MTSISSLHGGDVARIAVELRCEPDEILDFSANINPRGLPRSARAAIMRAADKLLRYPDWTIHPLRQALANRHNVSVENIILGAGASALIMDVFRAVRARRCLCFVPAFAEYRRACEATGSEFHSIALQADDQFQIDLPRLIADLKRVKPDLLIVNNPHNPSGSLTDRSKMETIMQTASELGATLLVDEAFIDYAPAHQITRSAVVTPGVISIRSLTKFYGCPGLRVGYAVAHASLASQILQQLPAWPVGTLAMDALHFAMQDAEYERVTLEETARARTNLVKELAHLGLRVFPGAANFVFAQLPEHWPDAATLKTSLLTEHRILIRDCSSFEGLQGNRFVRIAVLASYQNERLTEALRRSI